MTSEKPVVLIVGATGNTGQVVATSLLANNAFRIIVLVRPESQSKPVVAVLKLKGAEIRIGDSTRDTVEDLQRNLVGVDIVISLISAMAIATQRNLIQAAKNAGIKRVIPCDFGTACPPNRRALHDEKLEIRAFIREIGIPYTFIDVGWWMQLILPYPRGSTGLVADISHYFLGPGDVKTAVTSLNDIAHFVARIITGPRTLNQYVFCWSEEVNLKEAYDIAERISGEKLSDSKVQLSGEQILLRIADARENFAKEPSFVNHAMWTHFEYGYSMFVCGDNTLQKAKDEGALDAKDLYPDLQLVTLEQCAKEFYENPFTLDV